MDEWIIYILAALAVIMVLAIIFCVYKSIQAARTMNSIEKMLESAIKGEFNEKSFSEERFSKLESQFADYLQSSSLSAQNVKNDRDKI